MLTALAIINMAVAAVLINETAMDEKNQPTTEVVATVEVDNSINETLKAK